MQITHEFKKSQADTLTRLLATPGRSKDMLTYSEAAGFLFVVACAPEMIKPSEWLPLILGEGGVAHLSEESATEVLGCLMSLYNELNRQVQEEDVSLPHGCSFKEELEDNFSKDAPMQQWCRGFVLGHSWLEEMWDEFVPQAISEEFGVQLMVMSFFASKDVGKGLIEESAKRDVSLNDMAYEMQQHFPTAMGAFANLGRSIQTVLMEQEQMPQQPATSDKIGRNEPCPCGSGKKYKKCCALKLH